jgi:hypothetical protein
MVFFMVLEGEAHRNILSGLNFFPSFTIEWE